MKYLQIACLCCLIISGCARSTHRLVIGPDGEETYRLRCGNKKTMTDCIQEAEYICGRGYEVIRQEEDISPSVYGGARPMRNILIRCK